MGLVVSILDFILDALVQAREYELPPVPAFDINAVVPPILLPPKALSSLPSEFQALFDGSIASSPVRYSTRVVSPSRLTAAVTFFLNYHLTMQTSENNQLPRDQCLLIIIQYILGPGAEVGNNSLSASVSANSRLDGFVARQYEPPVVLMEQKATNGQLQDAIAHLNTKFVWMPHYHQNQYVFGMVTAGNLVQFGLFSRISGKWNPCRSPYDLTNVRGALDCLRGAINIGRACRDDTHPRSMKVRYGTRVDRGNTHTSHLYIFGKHVSKTYNSLARVERDRLKQFYGDTANVARLEHIVTDNTVEGPEDAATNASIQFYLTPVGVDIMPASADEVKRWLTDVLSVLAQVAELKWAIVDVRVENVVRLSDLSWVVIDAAEYATQHRKPLPANIDLAPSLVGTHANLSTDIKQLRYSIHKHPTMEATIRETDVGQQFWTKLSQDKVSAKLLLQHAYLK